MCTPYHAMEEDDIESWWEIPSIVHFCKVFSPICTDLFPVDITEFENAIKSNSGLLTNMAVRFIKICGFYDPNSFKWWTIMKQHFKEKYIEYNFEYSLDSVTYFDYLTRKQKVEALYILCHIILDVKNFQDKISLRHEIWNKLNVKPIGFDLNKSLYWYFGSTRLYREDFENTADLSTNSSTQNDTIQLSSSVSSNDSNSSNIDSCERFSTELYPFGGHFRTGKWRIICNDNNESWYSLADITENSKNINIRSLHRSICNIIQKLPQIKRNKSHYKYLKSPTSQLYIKHNIYTRSLRSTLVNETEYSEIATNSEVSTKEQCSQNVNLTKNNDLSLNSQSNKKENNTNTFDQNHVTLYSTNVYDNKKVEGSTNETKRNLRSSINLTENHCKNVKKIDFDPSNILKYDVQVKLKRYDQENTQKFDNSKQKLRTSKRFKTEIKIPPFKDLNC